VQPEDFALMVRDVLRRMRLEVAFRRRLPIAGRQEQVACASVAPGFEYVR
jgi:hypothetical protein